MHDDKYVLITAVRNEETHIRAVIESVLHQQIRPVEWIIVNDNSSDRTGAIIQEYSEKYDFISAIGSSYSEKRNFSSKVYAINAGYEALKTSEYSFIGILDGDIVLKPYYYKSVMLRFRWDSSLGLAGGEVVDLVSGRVVRYHGQKHSVAGGIQLFRKKCFQDIGGLMPMQHGGEDALAEVSARMHHWKTKTFGQLTVYHMKPRNGAAGGLLRRHWQMGIRDYGLHNQPLFEMAKCVYRVFEWPFGIGSLVRCAAYFSQILRGAHRDVPKELVKYLRAEQMRKVFPFFQSTVPPIHPHSGSSQPNNARSMHSHRGSIEK